MGKILCINVLLRVYLCKGLSLYPFFTAVSQKCKHQIEVSLWCNYIVDGENALAVEFRFWLPDAAR